MAIFQQAGCIWCSQKQNNMQVPREGQSHSMCEVCRDEIRNEHHARKVAKMLVEFDRVPSYVERYAERREVRG
jgi:predicted N-formylglutamate amidohydrolase